MPDYVDPNTLRLYRSRYPAPAGAVELSRAAYNAAVAIDGRYRKWNGSAVVEMSPAEKAGADQAAAEAARDEAAARLDEAEDLIRALALALLAELNSHAHTMNAILDAVDGATSLADFKARVAAIDDHPIRTVAQLRAAVRNHLGP